MAKVKISAVALLCMLVGASPLSALDITGSWYVTGACKGLIDDGLGPIKYKALGNLDITQTGSVAYGTPGGGVGLTGSVITDSADPNKGIVTLNTCGLSPASDSSEGNSVLMFSVKTGSDGKGTMKGSHVASFWYPGSNTNQFCKLKLKRYSIDNPSIGSCPP